MHIEMEETTARISVPGAPVLTVGVEEDILYFYDENGQAMEYTVEFEENGGSIRLEKESIEEAYDLTIDESNILTVTAGEHSAQFSSMEGELYHVDPNQQLVKIEPVPTFGFYGNEGFGSYRGYIWSRSIPMMRETLLMGHGPDLYPIYYPQKDYQAYINDVWQPNRVVDKPHNFYLQAGINTGLPSLLALLALFGMYLTHSIRLYYRCRDFTSIYAAAGAGCLLAVTSYLVAGIGNDSVVSVAPVFWILLGLGIHCNIRVQADQQAARETEHRK